MISDPNPSLEQRLRLISRRLFDALRASFGEGLVEHGGAHRLRPMVLTEKLGLDKSLASRVARAMRESDELRALHAIPTPKGLQQVERALQEQGASEESMGELASAVDAYRDVLAEFSGGRTGLEATLAGWIPEQRAKADRDARRLIFRGTTTLEGTRTGTAYTSIYVVPSPDEEDKLDVLVVAVREDLCRLRADEDIPLTAIDGHQRFGDWRERRRGLSKNRKSENEFPADDPRSLILPELSSAPVPTLEVIQSGDSTVVRIARGALDVNEVATVAFGWRMKAFFSRESADELAHRHISFTASAPTECLAVDLFFHESVAPRSAPVSGVLRAVDMDHDAMAAPPTADSDARLKAPPVTRLDNLTSALNTPDLRNCREVAEHTAKLANLELSHFQGFRCRFEFPMTTEALTLWWQL